MRELSNKNVEIYSKEVKLFQKQGWSSQVPQNGLGSFEIKKKGEKIELKMKHEEMKKLKSYNY